MTDRICILSTPHDPCSIQAKLTRALCPRHYYRFAKYGDPTRPLRRKARNGEPLAWLRDAVANRHRDGGCWLDWPYGVSRAANGAPRPVLTGSNAAPIILELDDRPKPHPSLFCCHSPECVSAMCLNPDHLRWDTQRENQIDTSRRGSWRNQHAFGPEAAIQVPAKGRTTRGEGINISKLTEQTVREIRQRYAGGETQAALAHEFGVAQGTLSAMCARKTWKHVD